jgi:DNA processing protein
MEETPLAPETLGPLDDGERFDWLRLLRCENVGPRTFQVLLNRHGSAGAALASLPALIASGKAGRAIRIASVEETEREIEAAQRLGARFIGIGEPDYPALLRATASAPPLIAVRGNLSSLRRSKIAIVGARNASAAGLAFTSQLARGIARAGHVIVSGLARGIDARAHQAAIETGTIAVIAGGLGNIYPSEHEALLERLLEQGAAISEMPFGWEARGRDFPRRNRIVAGLCRAVVVVEAARRSGSLNHRKIRRRRGPRNLCGTGLAARSAGGRRQRSVARRCNVLHQGGGCHRSAGGAKPVAYTTGNRLFRAWFRRPGVSAAVGRARTSRSGRCALRAGARPAR